MAKPGPKPKPNNVRRLHGDRASRFNYSAPVPPEQEAQPPDWLSDSGRERWDALTAQMRAMRVGPYAADEEAILALVLAADNVRRLGKVLNGAPAVIRDKDGMPAPNPLMSRWERASRHLLGLAAEFGLSPSSRDRMRLGSLTGDDYDDLAGVPEHR